MPDWLSRTDDGLSAQAQQYSAYITAHTVALGLVAGDATLLATNVTNFVDKLAVTKDDSTATKVATAEKDTARAVLVADMRSLARRLQANPNITDGQKTALGLPLHDTTHTPTPAPITRPAVSVMGVTMTEIAVRAVDETTPTSRKKPAGAAGLQYFSWLGNDPAPEDLELWRFEGLSTRSEFVIGYHPEDAGKPITIVARWYTRSGLVGPTSQPVTAGLAVPVALPIAA